MSWIDPELAAEFQQSGTDSYRIGEGYGWRIERFGPAAIVSYEAELPAGLLGQLDEWLREAGVALPRIFGRRLVQGPGPENAPRLLRGDASLGTVAVVQESGLNYEVDYLAGYSCGLFLDQRMNRRRLREFSPKRVLNTFAYTCSFSVTAAMSGAATLSLDLAKPALARGRRNFELNGLSLDAHRFIADDVMDVFPRLRRRRETFDAIILDPPTFSRNKSGRVFQVERDLDGLLEMALECLSPGGRVLLSTNCTALTGHHLESLARRVAPGSRLLRPEAMPDISPQWAATTLWIETA